MDYATILTFTCFHKHTTSITGLTTVKNNLLCALVITISWLFKWGFWFWFARTLPQYNAQDYHTAAYTGE